MCFLQVIIHKLCFYYFFYTFTHTFFSDVVYLYVLPLPPDGNKHSIPIYAWSMGACEEIDNKVDLFENFTGLLNFFRLENTSANLPAFSSQLHLPKAVSLRNMAASTGVANAAASDSKTGPVSSIPNTDSPTIQYSMVLEHLVGEKRPIKELSPGVMGGLPVPPKSDEQKMIERGMESCAFKSVLACVGGKQQPHTFNVG